MNQLASISPNSNSSKLEGNTLTYGQTIKLLKEFVTPKNAAAGELLDLINHQNILNNIFATYESQDISEDNVKALHKELMNTLRSGVIYSKFKIRM
jgi:Fic family protein